MSGRISYLGGIVQRNLVLNLDAGKKVSYPGAGTTWTDLTLNRYSAQLINGPTFSIDNGGSFSFVGDDYGRIPYNANFNLNSVDFSMDVWFNISSFLSPQLLISKDTRGTNYDWGIAVWNTTSLRIYSNGTSTLVSATVPTMSVNTWYNCVITSISGVIRIYLNNVLYSTPTSMSISNNSQVYMTIGCGGWNSPGDFLSGKISTIKLYRGYGLTQSDINQNFNALKGRYGY